MNHQTETWPAYVVEFILDGETVCWPRKFILRNTALRRAAQVANGRVIPVRIPVNHK